MQTVCISTDGCLGFTEQPPNQPPVRDHHGSRTCSAHGRDVETIRPCRKRSNVGFHHQPGGPFAEVAEAIREVTTEARIPPEPKASHLTRGTQGAGLRADHGRDVGSSMPVIGPLNSETQPSPGLCCTPRAAESERRQMSAGRGRRPSQRRRDRTFVRLLERPYWSATMRVYRRVRGRCLARQTNY